MKHHVRFNIFLLFILSVFLVTVGIGAAQARYEKTLRSEITLRYQGDVGLVYLLSSEKDASGAYVTDTNGYFAPPGGWDVVEDAGTDDNAGTDSNSGTDSNTGTDSNSDTNSNTGTNSNAATGTGAASVYQLSFLAANGRNARIPCEQDQKVSLAVFATVGVVKPENLTIVLTDGQSSYTAVPFALTEGMADYETYGPGWMYRFYNTAGEELSWPLAGGVFQTREFTLTVTGQSETVTALRLIAYASPGIL